MRVTVLGGAGSVGQPLCLLLQANERITELRIFDVHNDTTEGLALELSQLHTGCKNVSSYAGMRNIQKALQNADIVVIAAGVTHLPNVSRDQLMTMNAKIIKQLSEAIAMHGSASRPVVCILSDREFLAQKVAIVSEVLKFHGVYDPRKLLGVTTLDVIRAKRLLQDYYLFSSSSGSGATASSPSKNAGTTGSSGTASADGVPPPPSACSARTLPMESIVVDVIGGHEGKTIVPLLSQAHCVPPDSAGGPPSSPSPSASNSTSQQQPVEVVTVTTVRPPGNEIFPLHLPKVDHQRITQTLQKASKRISEVKKTAGPTLSAAVAGAEFVSKLVLALSGASNGGRNSNIVEKENPNSGVLSAGAATSSPASNRNKNAVLPLQSSMVPYQSTSPWRNKSPQLLPPVAGGATGASAGAAPLKMSTKTIRECCFIENTCLPGARFSAMPVLLGADGVQEILHVELATLSESEQDQIKKMLPTLVEHIESGRELALELLQNSLTSSEEEEAMQSGLENINDEGGLEQQGGTTSNNQSRSATRSASDDMETGNYGGGVLLGAAAAAAGAATRTSNKVINSARGGRRGAGGVSSSNFLLTASTRVVPNSARLSTRPLVQPATFLGAGSTAGPPVRGRSPRPALNMNARPRSTSLSIVQPQFPLNTGGLGGNQSLSKTSAPPAVSSVSSRSAAGTSVPDQQQSQKAPPLVAQAKLGVAPSAAQISDGKTAAAKACEMMRTSTNKQPALAPAAAVPNYQASDHLRSVLQPALSVPRLDFPQGPSTTIGAKKLSAENVTGGGGAIGVSVPTAASTSGTNTTREQRGYKPMFSTTLLGSTNLSTSKTVGGGAVAHQQQQQQQYKLQFGPKLVGGTATAAALSSITSRSKEPQQEPQQEEHQSLQNIISNARTIISTTTGGPPPVPQRFQQELLPEPVEVVATPNSEGGQKALHKEQPEGAPSEDKGPNYADAPAPAATQNRVLGSSDEDEMHHRSHAREGNFFAQPDGSVLPASAKKPGQSATTFEEHLERMKRLSESLSKQSNNSKASNEMNPKDQQELASVSSKEISTLYEEFQQLKRQVKQQGMVFDSSEDIGTTGKNTTNNIDNATSTSSASNNIFGKKLQPVGNSLEDLDALLVSTVQNFATSPLPERTQEESRFLEDMQLLKKMAEENPNKPPPAEAIEVLKRVRQTLAGQEGILTTAGRSQDRTGTGDVASSGAKKSQSPKPFGAAAGGMISRGQALSKGGRQIVVEAGDEAGVTTAGDEDDKAGPSTQHHDSQIGFGNSAALGTKSPNIAASREAKEKAQQATMEVKGLMDQLDKSAAVVTAQEEKATQPPQQLSPLANSHPRYQVHNTAEALQITTSSSTPGKKGSLKNSMNARKGLPTSSATTATSTVGAPTTPLTTEPAPGRKPTVVPISAGDGSTVASTTAGGATTTTARTSDPSKQGKKKGQPGGSRDGASLTVGGGTTAGAPAKGPTSSSGAAATAGVANKPTPSAGKGPEAARQRALQQAAASSPARLPADVHSVTLKEPHYAPAMSVLKSANSPVRPNPPTSALRAAGQGTSSGSPTAQHVVAGMIQSGKSGGAVGSKPMGKRSMNSRKDGPPDAPASRRVL
ncbi:unnamed protein product [Amoebophrya sp. A120]|nr:unnamed protein product [Amoebophrya sp. A120]|eukprot:GSA120T00008540001.1